MLGSDMKPRGLYKIANRARTAEAAVDPVARREHRVQRIVESLRKEIVEGNGAVRVRRVFETPREIFRLELELPEMGYQRTTLLDREALDALLQAEEIRSRVRS